MIADTVRPGLPPVLRLLSAVLALVAGTVPFCTARAAPLSDLLQAIAAAPAHVANRFSDDAIFVATSTGDYVVLDRRSHSVHVFDRGGHRVRRLADPGLAAGEVFDPLALAISGDDIIAVADSPNGYDRIQYFTPEGMRVGGFYLPVAAEPRLTIRNVLVASGSSLGFSNSTFVVSRPEWGVLISELDTTGKVVRQMGHPRAAGHTPDRALELAMNVGLALAEPEGGFYFVFQTGVPMFRKYGRDGHLLFERHIQGPELDARIQALPTVWPARPAGSRPVVPPMVRTASVDGSGRLWISLVVPYTYVYDHDGEKLRAVQFRGAGIISPSSFFFTAKGRLITGPGGYEFDVN
jgi:hypothetical protein